MIFKTPRIEAEYHELIIRNPKLMSLLACIAEFSMVELKKEAVITEIYRSEAEYKALYAANPAAIPKAAPHTKWQAADLRSSIYTPREIERLLSFIHCFTFYGGQRTTALYHMIAGNVPHFHVQYGNDV